MGEAPQPWCLTTVSAIPITPRRMRNSSQHQKRHIHKTLPKSPFSKQIPCSSRPLCQVRARAPPPRCLACESLTPHPPILLPLNSLGVLATLTHGSQERNLGAICAPNGKSSRTQVLRTVIDLLLIIGSAVTLANTE